ncbi:MAG: VOC family protein [Inquilinaceae bacterium]
MGRTPQTGGSDGIVSVKGVPIGRIVEGSPGATPFWLPYFAVADIDRAAEVATEAGAQSVGQPVMDPVLGRVLEIADPDGFRFRLCQSGHPVCYWRPRRAIGGPICFDRPSHDDTAALEFYQRVTGGEKTVHEDKGKRWTLVQPPDFFALFSRRPVADEWDRPIGWIPHLRVGQRHDAALLAIDHGAELYVMSLDLFDEGGFALLDDPQGATFYQMQIILRPNDRPSPLRAMFDAALSERRRRRG